MGGNALAPIEAPIPVRIHRHQPVGITHSSSQAGRIGVRSGCAGHLPDLGVTRRSPRYTGLGFDGSTAFLAVDAQGGACRPTAVSVPAELDGPPVGRGRGPGRQVLHRGTHQPNPEGLEGDQRRGGFGRHIADLEGHIVGSLPELVAVGLPAEGGRGGLSLSQSCVEQPGVGGLDQLAGCQGGAILAHVEDAPEAGDDDPLAIGIGGRDGLVDQGAGLHAQVRDGGQQGAFVEVVNHHNLHIAGDFPDEHAVSPLFDDEGEVVLAFLAGGVPAEFTGGGVDGEGGGTPGFAGGAEAGGVLIHRNCSTVATCRRSSLFWNAESEGQAVAIHIEGGRVVAELLVDASGVQGWVEHDGGRVQAQVGIDQNRRRDE
ncbi:hypothetical protein, partial [Spirosoma jeollabukense]